jgi:zinc D-Ala-D-Ala carboxypeptidase
VSPLAPPGQYFSWSELTRTSTGRPNDPTPAQRDRLRVLVTTVLDPLRVHLGRPVRVTSGYRTPDVNAIIGGSRTSAHMKGEAADIKVGGMDARALVQALLLLDPEFDQIIGYAPERGGHVHVGIAARPRWQVLWAPAGGGYTPWPG